MEQSIFEVTFSKFSTKMRSLSFSKIVFEFWIWRTLHETGQGILVDHLQHSGRNIRKNNRNILKIILWSTIHSNSKRFYPRFNEFWLFYVIFYKFNSIFSGRSTTKWPFFLISSHIFSDLLTPQPSLNLYFFQ